MLINLSDVVDGALVNAIALAGRRISVAVDGLRGRRRADDLTAARWFETYSLTTEHRPASACPRHWRSGSAAILSGDEIQAALQELLAARLTDAPETDAASARQVLSLTLNRGRCRPGSPSRWPSYYDDQICALVGPARGRRPPAAGPDPQRGVLHPHDQRPQRDRAAHRRADHPPGPAHRGQLPDQVPPSRHRPARQTGTARLRPSPPGSHRGHLRPDGHHRRSLSRAGIRYRARRTGLRSTSTTWPDGSTGRSCSATRAAARPRPPTC